MKFYQFDKIDVDCSFEDYIWQFLIIKNKSLFSVYYRSPSNTIHDSGGINILFSLFTSSTLLGIDFQQRKFELAFFILCEYFPYEEKS